MSSNPFYQATGAPAPLSRGISYTIASEYQLVQAGFDGVNTVEIANAATAAAATALKGNITTQAWLGTHDFTGASSVLVPTPTLINQAVTKAYADGLAFATALPAQAGNAGLFVTTNGTTASWATIVQALPFGNGSDGNVTVTGALTLTRDMFYNNLTLNSAAAITTAGYRIFVAGTLDISAAPAGAIKWNSAASSTNLGSSGGNGAGGAQAGTGLPGNAGSAGTSGKQGGASLAAGTGGAGYGTLGGAAGAGAASAYQPSGYVPNCPTGLILSGTTLTLPLAASGAPGGGGGGGASDMSGTAGGAGALGGGTVVIIANVIYRGTNTTAGIIQAKGGNGTAGVNGGNGGVEGSSGGGGGGSGGGGGWIVIIANVLTGSAITGAIYVSGGAGANGGVGGFNTSNLPGAGGGGGASGGSGVVEIYNSSASTVTLVATSAGTAGTAGAAGIGSAGGIAGIGASANIKQVNL